MSQLVMTLIGTDRPGLVEMLSATVAAHGGNWLESRLAHLAGRFAGLVRIEAPDENVAALKAALGDISELTVVVESGSLQQAVQAPVRLEVVGQDRPGIVRQLSQAIARNGFNVEELSSAVTSAPMSGEPIFTAKFLLHARDGADVERLRLEIEKIAADLMVETRLGAS
ncbi:MAG: ACT domain-containing protein [Verrucomicrobiales bacterium]|nr:ACT domain-containing protein [Verrucomicrobiales bacterium]